MTLRKQVGKGNERQFPPEADENFGIVSEDDISSWREKLSAKYGIGQGKLIPLDDPAAA